MITNKDRESAISMTKIWIRDSEGNQLEDIAGIISRIRAESAEQARKEAAERVHVLAGSDCFRNPSYGEGYERGLYDAYHAILGDSAIKENLTTDHSTDIGKKLAIAVKALEEIQDVDTQHNKIARDALKEIQG